MTHERDEAAEVAIAGAGLVRWRVVTWLRAAERFGVTFRVVGNRLEYDLGQFACIDGLPAPARAFLAEHADELRRVVLATPSRVM
ncbi:hypothetical protein [Luteitalea sp.]|uniref:hypothetical protein n=1 Tax=Luteitalea sp. TaxID=2004800 RepID=UPI0025C26F37|nr:hypothetical protein [Luteitalea sp.]